MWHKYLGISPTLTKTVRSAVLLLIALICFLSFGCTTNSAALKVLSPAAFAVPENIKTIGLVNRSIPKKNFGNVLEGLLTGEGLHMDRNAARYALNGVLHQLNDSPRFKAKATGVEIQGSAIGINFPNPMPIAEVKDLCLRHKVDALLVLEAFDSDRDEYIDIRNNGDGQDFLARQITKVRLGWRLYDPKGQMLIDEFMAYEEHEWNDAAASNAQAEQLFPRDRSNLNDACYTAGRTYAARISPSYNYLRRPYYQKAKGDKKMKEAGKLARKGNWDAAAKIWATAAKSKEEKVAGRAAYNMALVNELKNNLPVAYDWAKQAYSDHGLQAAKPYVMELKERLQNEQLLKEQLQD